MLLLHKKVQQILIDAGIFNRQYIEFMLSQYNSSVVRAIFDIIQIYIENENLTEAEKYIQSQVKKISSKKQSSIDDQLAFVTELMNLLKDYPDIPKLIQKEIQYLDEELDEIIMSSLNDKLKMQILDIIEADLEEMEKSTKIADQLMSSPQFDKV